MRASLGIIIAIVTMGVVGCGNNPPSVIPYEDIPAEGDPVRGEQLFHEQIGIAPTCESCHNENSNASPDLTGYSEVAGTRVEDESAHEYTFYAIAEPGRFIVEGYGNAMYNQYDDNYEPQDIADLIAYLLSL